MFNKDTLYDKNYNIKAKSKQLQLFEEKIF